MSGVATAVGAAAVIGYAGAKMSADAAGDAAQKQTDAANAANGNQFAEYQQTRADQLPWLQAGQAAMPQLSALSSQAPSFTKQDFLNNEDPAYQFDLQQGQQALERSAAASGGLQTGSTLKALTNYAQGAASNEYQNAYGRFMNSQNTQFNRLASVAGLGQTAAGEIGQAGQNMTNQVGANLMGAANAQGAAGIAKANVWANTLSSLGTQGGNYLMQNQMLNRIFPNSGAPGAGMGAGVWAPPAGQTETPMMTLPASEPTAFNTLAGMS